MSTKCQQCGAPIDGAFCPYCGGANPSAQANFQQSNTQPQQGNAQPQQGYAQPIVINNYAYANTFSPKNKLVAFILCFFVGYLGIHYFYVGKAGMGLLYLFTGGLFGIGWIIDLIRILCGSFKDSMNLPLKK